MPELKLLQVLLPFNCAMLFPGDENKPPTYITESCTNKVFTFPPGDKPLPTGVHVWAFKKQVNRTKENRESFFFNATTFNYSSNVRKKDLKI